MYCSSCGSPIPDDARFCGRCGRPIAGLAAASAGAAHRRLARHLPVLALLWVVYSALRILAGAAAIFAGSVFMPRLLASGYRPFGFHYFGWPFSHFMLCDWFVGAGLGALILGALGLAAAWGLSRHEAWGRLLALILGILALFRFPFGTVLGIYTLWLLVPRDAAVEYRRPAILS